MENNNHSGFIQTKTGDVLAYVHIRYNVLCIHAHRKSRAQSPYRLCQNPYIHTDGRHCYERWCVRVYKIEQKQFAALRILPNLVTVPQRTNTIDATTTRCHPTVGEHDFASSFRSAVSTNLAFWVPVSQTDDANTHPETVHVFALPPSPG